MGPGLVRTAMSEGLMAHPQIGAYVAGFAAAMTAGRDVPPEQAGELAVFLAGLRDPRLSGRVFGVGSDYAAVLEQADAIARDDLYTLRLRR